ncbi:hypothetical protein [Bergeyella sp. RCAD1439]|uniref:hypothetical protein n=1 Tax=Bergeyella anatis TaxID=3113737 RepID=UPI002E18F81C|nr:hypothetical protein [Bergeyella sp. RCAD1439]
MINSQKVLIVFIVLGLISCEKKINSLDSKILKYEELPKAVKNKVFYSNGRLQEVGNPHDFSFQEINTPKQYEYYTKKEWFFPWIYKEYIKDKDSKIEYSLKAIGEERGNRYIVYGDSLYIANHYLLYEEDSLSYTFTRFILR